MASGNTAKLPHTVLFWFGVIGCLAVFTVLFVSETIQAAEDRYNDSEELKMKKPALSTGVQCAVPNEFPSSMEQFHESSCKMKLDAFLKEGLNETERPKLYVLDHTILRDAPTIKRKDIIPDEIMELLNKTVIRDASQPHDLTLYWYVIAQLVLASVAYFSCVSLSASDMTSKRKRFAYVITSVVAGLTWLVIACLVYTCSVNAEVPVVKEDVDSRTPQAEKFTNSGEMLCEVNVKRLTNVQQYTHECIYTVSATFMRTPSPPVSHAANLRQVAAVADTALAFMSSALWFVLALSVILAVTGYGKSEKNVDQDIDRQELKPV